MITLKATSTLLSVALVVTAMIIHYNQFASLGNY